MGIICVYVCVPDLIVTISRSSDISTWPPKASRISRYDIPAISARNASYTWDSVASSSDQFRYRLEKAMLLASGKFCSRRCKSPSFSYALFSAFDV